MGHRAFVHLAVTDVAMIAIGWGVFTWLLPPFAPNDVGLSTTRIGLLLTVVALAAAVSMLRLERRLPEATRLTPRPRR